MVEGRPAADFAGTLAAMTNRMYANNAAKAAIEIALHDLVGRGLIDPVDYDHVANAPSHPALSRPTSSSRTRTKSSLLSSP